MVSNRLLISHVFLCFILGSPALTPPAGNILPNSEFFALNGGTTATSASSPNGLPSTPPTTAQTSLLPPAGNYLPQFPFGQPGFLPYDLQQLRTANGIRPVPTSTTPSLPSNEHMSRLSPASSRNSSSSPPPTGTPTSSHLAPHHRHLLGKINNSVELNSTNEQSSDQDSDEEHIDVVKSAFVPILRPQLSTITTTAKLEMVVDSPLSSTGTNGSPSPQRQKCELKAPSSKKLVHETAPRANTSLTTKIKTESTQKQVWRPY